jgi:hypothetical protein
MSEKVNVAKTWEDAVLDNFEEQDSTTVQDEFVNTASSEETIVAPANDAIEIVLPEGAEIVSNEAEEIVTPEAVPVTEEKVVERYPEMSDDAKKLLEALQAGNEDELFNYLSEKRKDYNTMSDYDVVKENIIRSNPNWTEKDIAIELKSKYGVLSAKKDLSEIDEDIYPDEYKSAVEFNELIEERETILARDAREARRVLDEQKKNIEFPKLTQEVQNQPTDEEIAEANKQWEAMVVSEVPKISDFKYKLNGEDVVYKITEEERTNLTETMKGFNASEYLSKRGWFDQEGNPNILKISEDVYKLENQGKMIGSVATQIKTATRKEVISRDIKNIDMDDKSSSDFKVSKPFWQVFILSVDEHDESGASEYELYFNYMYAYHINDIIVRKLTWTTEGRKTINIYSHDLNKLQRDFISLCHYYK